MENDPENNWKQGLYKKSSKELVLEFLDTWIKDRNISWKSSLEKVKEKDTEAADYWEEIANDIEGIAKAYIDSSEKFGKTESMSEVWCKFFELIDEYPQLVDYIRELMTVQMFRKVIGQIDERVDRLLSLYMWFWTAGKIELFSTLNNFLQLVVRNYICGFDAECIILCRSAVEMTIEDRVTYDMCEKHLGPPKGGYYTLKSCLVVAKKEGLINDEIAKIAQGIKDRGNTVVHKDPKVTEKVFETINETIRFISVITSGIDPDAPPDWLKTFKPEK